MTGKRACDDMNTQLSRREERAIRAALRPDGIADYAQNCHLASVRLVEASETRGTALSQEWRNTARVARGACRGVFGPHSWVVVGGGRIVDVTLWSYDPAVPECHTTTVNDPRYVEPPL